MMMSSRLLKLCEEFFSELAPGPLANPSLDQDIDSLVEYLKDRIEFEDDVDEASLIEDVRLQLDTIWSQVDPIQRAANPTLVRHFEEVNEHLDYFESEARPAGYTDDGYDVEDDPETPYLSDADYEGEGPYAD